MPFDCGACLARPRRPLWRDRKSTRLNSSHTEIYTLSLHDALPIWVPLVCPPSSAALGVLLSHAIRLWCVPRPATAAPLARSEEHTSELQSHRDLHSFPTRRSSDLGASGMSTVERCTRCAPESCHSIVVRASPGHGGPSGGLASSVHWPTSGSRRLSASTAVGWSIALRSFLSLALRKILSRT